jgi:hypothetical protein
MTRHRSEHLFFMIKNHSRRLIGQWCISLNSASGRSASPGLTNRLTRLLLPSNFVDA